MLELDKRTCFSKKLMSAKEEWDEAESTFKNHHAKCHARRKAFDRRSEISNRIEMDEEASTNLHTKNYSVFSDSDNDSGTNDDVDDGGGHSEECELIIGTAGVELEFRTVIKV